MRGQEKKQSSALCLISPASRVPERHPLRGVKLLADAALSRLSPVFDVMYSDTGRPSIPPETLLKGTLLMALYSIRSERQLCDQINYNLLFRWFLDMDMMEDALDASTFSKNRERLLECDVAGEFFREVVSAAEMAGLMSSEHFTVDGTLIEAAASLKSFKEKGKGNDRNDPPDDPGNADVDFRGQRRSNQTHESTTDPEARLARKGNGKEAKLSFGAHALMENRNGLLVDIRVSEANGRAEPETALAMLRDACLPVGASVGADRGYDQRPFVDGCRELGVVPHVAAKKKHSAVDRRTVRHATYAVSQRLRKRVEEIFGWAKTVGGFRRTRHRGKDRTQLSAYLVGAAYNLLRMAKLLESPA
jgi:transposase